MVESMTGFGISTFEFEDSKLSVEIKSINSKSIDLNLRLPTIYKEKEMSWRKKIAEVLQRGKVDCIISIESTFLSNPNIYKINKELVENYISQLKEINIKCKKSNYLKMALKMPEIFDRFSKNEAENENKEKENKLQKLLEETLTKLKKSRQEEGKIIKKEFSLGISVILSYLKQVDQFEEERKNTLKNKFENALREFSQIDKNRLEQELIYYYEKLDISEEKVRLKAHCNYFLETLEESTSQGKKLGFILQEINREINTLGAKSSHWQMQKCVVLMKEELEKIKEQISNVV